LIIKEESKQSDHSRITSHMSKVKRLLRDARKRIDKGKPPKRKAFVPGPYAFLYDPDIAAFHRKLEEHGVVGFSWTGMRRRK